MQGLQKSTEKPTKTGVCMLGDAYQGKKIFKRRVKLRNKNSFFRINEPISVNWSSETDNVLNFRKLWFISRQPGLENRCRTASRLRAYHLVVIGVLLLVTISVAIYAFIQQNRATAARATGGKRAAASRTKKGMRPRSRRGKTATEIAEQQRQVALVRAWLAIFPAVSKNIYSGSTNAPAYYFVVQGYRRF